MGRGAVGVGGERDSDCAIGVGEDAAGEVGEELTVSYLAEEDLQLVREPPVPRPALAT